jgi:RNA polymerase subunit RPABC4/transcription elongation factor Spt4
MDIPKRRVCANCKNTYREGDKYCRYCGAPMGKPDFIEEDFACIYGPPPVTRVHKCKKCGYSWETSLMIDDEKWCPECGGEAPFGEGAGE